MMQETERHLRKDQHYDDEPNDLMGGVEAFRL